MSKIVDPGENLFDAINVVIADGYVAIEGTKTPAIKFCSRVIDALAAYQDIRPVTSFRMVANRGYLYLVVDGNRHSPTGPEFHRLVEELDRRNPI